jgi:hypothetical protein
VPGGEMLLPTGEHWRRLKRLAMQDCRGRSVPSASSWISYSDDHLPEGVEAHSFPPAVGPPTQGATWSEVACVYVPMPDFSPRRFACSRMIFSINCRDLDRSSRDARLS